MPVLIRVANKYSIYDVPSDRKIHPKSISSLGGIGIYFGIVLGLFAARLFDANQHFDPYFFFILFGMTVLFLNGLGDDLFGFTANQKFLIQFSICFCFIDSRGVVQLYLQELIQSYIISRIILSIALVTIINSINLLDGIDGLAGTIGVFMGLVFFVLNFVHGNYPLAILSLSLVGALMGFLYFNFSPAKIFMGDSGSLLVGFIIAFLAISTPYKEYSLTFQHTKVQVINIILATISFPVFEVIRLFSFRLISGASPFIGDRNHLHHMLVDSGYTARKAVKWILFYGSFQLLIPIFFTGFAWYSFIFSLFLEYILMVQGLKFVLQKKIKLSNHNE